jgi:type II secretion system protein N
MKWSFNKRVLGYILFGIIIIIAFLYLRFPGKVIGDYLESIVSARNPDATLVIGVVKPYFLPGFKLEKIAYGSKSNPAVAIHLNYLTARPDFINLFKGKMKFLLKGEAYGGLLQGYCDFMDFLSLMRPSHYEIKLSNVGLDQLAYVKGTLNRNVTGKLNAKFAYRRSYDRIGESTGTGEFTIVNGSYQLLENIMGFERIDFSRIEGRLSMKGDTLKIDRMKLTSTKFNCSLQGEIVLNNEIEQSPITMNGTIEIAGMGGRKMNTAIGGIMGNPTIRLMP